MRTIFTIIISMCIYYAQAGQIPYPSGKNLTDRFKTEKTLAYLERSFDFENINASTMKIYQIKGENNKYWNEYKTKDLRRSTAYRSWPNDLLIGYVKIETAQNKHGESYTLTYKTQYRRTSVVANNIKLLDTWEDDGFVLTDIRIKNNTLTDEKIKDLYLDYLNAYKSSFNEVVQVISVKQMPEQKVSVTFDGGLYEFTGIGGLYGNYLTIPVEYEQIIQETSNQELEKTIKTRAYSDITFQRENGIWRIKRFSVSSPLDEKELSDITTLYSTPEQVNAYELYQKYVPYKAEPYSELGKKAFAEELHRQVLGLTLETANKEKEQTLLSQYTSDKEKAIKMWDDLLDLKMRQIEIGKDESYDPSHPIKESEIGNETGRSSFYYEYSGERNLSKEQIKELKKVYGKTYLQEWQKPLENRKVVYNYNAYFSEGEWKITQFRINILRQ